MTIATYIAAYALVPLFGLSLASSIDARSARIGFAFLAGALLLTIEATLFTMIGIRWSIVGLSLPLLVASGMVVWHRRSSTDKSVCATPLAIAIIIIALLHFLLSIITTQSINPDYVLFGGTKPVHFARARALAPGSPLPRYAPPRIDSPPLLPIVQAWGLLFSHQMPWITAAAMSTVWLVAPGPGVPRPPRSIHPPPLWAAAGAGAPAVCGRGGDAGGTV